MTESDLEISDSAPTDPEGHPVHPDPDKSHRICAAKKSEKTTPTEHGRERDDVAYCTLAAGWGVDGKDQGPCKHHAGAIDNRGENNPNYEHGAYSEFQDFMLDSLSDQEREAVNALDLDEDAEQFAKDVVKEAYAKYLRTGDDRFLRETRQWASEFGVIESAPEKIEADVDVDQTIEPELSDQEREHLDQLTGMADVDQ